MVEIRLATRDDVPAILTLVAEVLAEFGLTFGTGAATDEQLRRLPESYAGGAFWVARDASSNALVGTCGVYLVADGVFELRKMYLATSARGRGVGKQLLDVAIAFAREHGGRRMVLDTVEAMARAIAFYEAHGFVRDDGQIRGSRCTRGYTREL